MHSRTAAEPPPTESATSPFLPSEGGAAVSPQSTPAVTNCKASADASVESEVAELINLERISRGVAARALHTRLTTVPQPHAADMACNQFTSYTSWMGHLCAIGPRPKGAPGHRSGRTTA